MPRIRHVTLPAGFVAAGVACGVKRSGKNDLAIIAATDDAAAAMVTTRNQVVGAPVLYSRSLLPKGYGRVRGLVINAGIANVCTGTAGIKDARTMGRLTAHQLHCPVEKVLVASTGVIGHRLPMDKIRQGISAAAAQRGTGNDSATLQSIMTTDTREKSAVVRTRIGGKLVTVAGIAKGSGMIAPSMATMIAVLTTDAAASGALLHRILKDSVATTFNAITVDSDTSTSDTVVLLASGCAGNTPLRTGSPATRAFAAAVHEVCAELARAVVADGEGATKVIEIAVTGAASAGDAQIAAKSVANSPLLKCALHSGDPNWGRIVAALGKSAAKIVPEKLSVRIGGVTIFARGMGRKFDLKRVATHMAGTDVQIACNLGLGKGAFTALTCDLSHEYVTINADYHT